jgi:hypothetical protein
MWKKNENQGHQRYISHMCGDRTPSGGMWKLGTFIDAPDVMNQANFHLYMMNILQASGGSKNGLSL